jgi:hypothetical protein
MDEVIREESLDFCKKIKKQGSPRFNLGASSRCKRLFGYRVEKLPDAPPGGEGHDPVVDHVQGGQVAELLACSRWKKLPDAPPGGEGHDTVVNHVQRGQVAELLACSRW